MQDLVKSILFPSHLQEWSRHKVSKSVHYPTWCEDSLESSEFLHESSQAFSVSAQHEPPCYLRILPYSTLSNLPRRSTISQIHEGRDNGDFYFSKFYILLPNELLKVCLIITASYLKRKKDLDRSKLEGIIFYINFLLKFSKTKILPNSQGGQDSVEYGNYLYLCILLDITSQSSPYLPTISREFFVI